MEIEVYLFAAASVTALIMQIMYEIHFYENGYNSPSPWKNPRVWAAALAFGLVWPITILVVIGMFFLDRE
jgi:hypothetical protein